MFLVNSKYKLVEIEEGGVATLINLVTNHIITATIIYDFNTGNFTLADIYHGE
jgi:hypothetical protein